MKICFVSFEYPPQFGGGIGTYVGNITSNLAGDGHEVHVVTFNPSNLPEYENLNKIHIHRISMDGPHMDLINNASSANLSTLLYWSHYSEKVYWKLKELRSVYTFQVIEFCDYRGEGYFTMLAKRTRGEFKDAALIVRLHTPLFVLNKYNKMSNDPGMDQLVQFENFSLLMADHVVSPTKILAALTSEELNYNKPISIVPHPIDLNSIPVNEYKNEKNNYFLYVGRLEQRKGVIDLVKAFIKVASKYTDIKLRLVGGDTNSAVDGQSMKRYLMNLIPRELIERFEFIDRLPREEVLKQYRNSFASIFPSLFENFPNVCLEAMASCVPVIVSDFSGMSEMIQDGYSGIVFKAGDYEDLIQKIEEVYNLSYDSRKTMGLNARQRVEQAYSINVINEEHIDYYEKISTNNYIQSSSKEYVSKLVSVIIPCYNHGKYLDETLDSVYKSSYTNFEIIIVNDGSTDPETISVLNRLEKQGHKIIHQENSGLSAARNCGINNARGEYILPLDADDLIDTTFLEKTVEVMLGDPEIGFVYTHVQFFGAASGVWKTPEFDPALLLISNLCVATSLFRHEAFDQIGGYKEDMIYGFEDWDFWIYMVECGWKGKCVPEPLFFYRKHQESMLSNSQKNRAFLIEKLVEHHSKSYQQSLKYVIVEKDKMFFNEHMSNYFNYTELNLIKSSKAWKAILYYRKIKDKIKSKIGSRK